MTLSARGSSNRGGGRRWKPLFQHLPVVLIGRSHPDQALVGYQLGLAVVAAIWTAPTIELGDAYPPEHVHHSRGGWSYRWN
ncbi:unnamed protein product [Ilex paraguariensis]|uniref:Uncharacterized protein n=1 Tax=Ilex paraguariensis TaxID=185542 RepID=A0ABC8SAB9_9AQUA